MLDPSISTAVAAVAESLCGKITEHDPGTLYGLKALSGACIKLDLNSPSLNFYIHINDEGLRFTAGNDDLLDPPTTLIRGKAADAFLFLFKDKHSLANSGLNIEGNVQILAELQTLFSNVEFDWEEILSDRLGTTAGPIFAKQVRAILNTSKEAAQTMRKRIEPILVDELQAAINNEEFKHFQNQCDTLAFDLEFAEQKLSQLKATLNKG